MRPLPPQICTGRVFHRRLSPEPHEFVYPVSYVLFDPDRPTELTDGHRLWSTGRRSPVQVRPEDYGGSAAAAGRMTLATEARLELDAVLTANSATPSASSVPPPRAPVAPAPVRLLSQPRRWGWLFNPISVYFVWPSSVVGAETKEGPLGVVLEVTNTPWKERHRYPVPLTAVDGSSGWTSTFEAEFDKVLHVSPFLDEDFTYRLGVAWRADQSPAAVGQHSRHLQIRIDAVDLDGSPVLETRLDLAVADATGSRLAESLRRHGLPTHRTSFGIHRQALSLVRKRVPFVAHPRSRDR